MIEPVTNSDHQSISEKYIGGVTGQTKISEKNGNRSSGAVVIFVYSALILSTLLVFWQVRNFDFVNYDDGSYVYDNARVLNGLTRDNLTWAFTSCPLGYWQPLTWLSLMINSQLFGAGAGGFHLVNVLLHLANTLLLFYVLKKMTSAIWPSAFVAALFAIHPMHVESVVWVSERKDVLSTLFWLLTMLAYVRYVEKPSIGRYVTAIIFFALGLMAKPMLVTLPFVLILLDYWPLNRIYNRHSTIDTRQFLRLLLEKVPFFVLAAVSSIVTFMTQKVGAIIVDTKTVPLADRIVNAFLSYAKYTGKLFVPRNLAVFYPYDANSFAFWQIAMCVALLVVISVLVIYFGRNRRYLPAGWFWFIGTLVPVIGLVTFTGSSYADRFTYIPYIGLFIMIAWGLPELLSKCPPRRIAAGETSPKAGPYRKIVLGTAASVTLIAFGTGAFRQVSVWKDSITLFSHALEVTHNNAVVHNYLGNSYYDLKRYQDAIESCRQAINIMPDYAEAHYYLGNAYSKLGRNQEAVDAYKQALKIKPDYAEAYNSLGNAYVDLGRLQEAQDAFKQAINAKPDFAEAHNNLGNASFAMGHLQEAIENYKQAILIKPDLALPYCNLGAVYGKIGSFQDALEVYKRAAEIDPNLAEANNGFGAACLDLGRYQEAIEPLKQAVRIEPNYADAHYNLANAYSKLGRQQDAIENYKQAIRIKPDYAEAHYNLGLTYLIAGDRAAALEEYRILKTLDAGQADQLYNLINK
jgi:tetratricopeptide (TPR) repeat protein